MMLHDGNAEVVCGRYGSCYAASKLLLVKLIALVGISEAVDRLVDGDCGRASHYLNRFTQYELDQIFAEIEDETDHG